jgi:hypothetical protein
VRIPNLTQRLAEPGFKNPQLTPAQHRLLAAQLRESGSPKTPEQAKAHDALAQWIEKDLARQAQQAPPPEPPPPGGAGADAARVPRGRQDRRSGARRREEYHGPAPNGGGASASIPRALRRSGPRRGLRGVTAIGLQSAARQAALNAITGIGAEPGYHEHLSPSTRVPTLASGCRSIVRMSIARLVRQPGQCMSSHGVPAIRAQRIVGDHSAPHPSASAAFQRSTTRTASSWAACSAARALR